MDKKAQLRAQHQRTETHLYSLAEPQSAIFRVTMWHLHIVQKNNWQRYVADLAKRNLKV